MSLPIRTRLTLASAALITVVLAGAGVFVYLRLEADLMQAVDAGLRSRADAMRSAPGGPAVRLGETVALVEPEEAFAQMIASDGRVLEASPGLGAEPLLLADRLVGIREALLVETIVSAGGETVPARILAVPDGAGRVLLVGASLDDQQDALERLAVLLAIGGPAALVGMVAVTWLVVGAALRPVEAMRSEAEAISASEPGRRLPVSGTGDELTRLGETLNAMLDRLEESIERERRFVDDASHELRTPLSNLRTELDLALRRSRSVDELERALRSASEETDRLWRLAEDLLVLARADRGRLPVRRSPIELSALIGAAAEPFAAAAAERRVEIEIRVPGVLRVELDEPRVRQALGNLLDNALRHTPAGGRVTIEGARHDGEVRIEVRDTGAGFDPDFLPRAFEAFALPSAARTRPEGGAGLGLAIVRAVAEAHGGRADVHNVPGGGASVVLTMPAESAGGRPNEGT